VTKARTICLHGPESVGKSIMAEQLAAALDAQLVPEYGRAYCARHGTDLRMADLVDMAMVQTDLIAEARETAPHWVVADTDALMTAVWADMMLGKRDAWFARFDDMADLYLLLDIDLPFVDDGLRIYGGADERARFFDLCKAELERREVAWALVGGMGKARLENALTAIRERFGN